MSYSDCYARLGLSPGATIDDVRRSFKTQALRYHPDKNNSPDAARQFCVIKSAHDKLIEILSVKNLKENLKPHNSTSSRQASPSEERKPKWNEFESDNFDHSKYWHDFFNAEFNRRPSSSSQPPNYPLPPSEHEMWLSLEQLFIGATKKMPILRTITDRDGKKTYEVIEFLVPVKKGMEEGECILFQGQGDRKPGTRPGDVIFLIKEKPHSLFKRIKTLGKWNIDLLYETSPIPISRLSMPSYLVEIPTIDGVNLYRPISDFYNFELRIPNRGMLFFTEVFKDQSHRGHLVVKLNLLTPMPANVPPPEEKGPEKVYDLPVNYEFLFVGTQQRMTITRINIHGEIENKEFLIEIKPGTYDGQRIVFPNEGDRKVGQISGDIVFIIRAEVDLGPVSRKTRVNDCHRQQEASPSLSMKKPVHKRIGKAIRSLFNHI